MKDKALKLALEALENFKEVVVAAQVLGIKVGATGKNMRLGESFLHDETITAIKEALAQPEQDLIPKEDLFVCGQMGAHVTRVYAQPEQPEHQLNCASLTTMLTSMPPQPARCNCKIEQPEQELVLQDIEQYRLQMAGISTAAIGYWKESDGILPDYDTVALRDVAKLYSKYDALYKARWSTQPEQEPVTWMCKAFDGEACEQSNHDECENPIPLYTTPQKQEWVGLTDEHIGIVLNDPNIAEVHQGTWSVLPYAYAYAIEAKSKELNK